MAEIGVPLPESYKKNVNGGVIPKVFGVFVSQLPPLTLTFLISGIFVS